MSDLVTVQIDGASATLSLNRPEKRHALSLRVAQGLRQAYEPLPTPVKVLILAGAGPHVSAGLDWSELSVATPQEGLQHFFAWYEAFGKLKFGRMPVVCAMQDAVVGGGLELASSQDLSA